MFLTLYILQFQGIKNQPAHTRQKHLRLGSPLNFHFTFTHCSSNDLQMGSLKMDAPLEKIDLESDEGSPLTSSRSANIQPSFRFETSQTSSPNYRSSESYNSLPFVESILSCIKQRSTFCFLLDLWQYFYIMRRGSMQLAFIQAKQMMIRSARTKT